MKITRAVVPSLFTVLNVFSGFMSLVASTGNDFTMAAWFIILGAVFDSFDGIMARITKSSSAFGVELDSLSDIVTFGAAPALLVYQVCLHTLGGVGLLVSSMPLIFGGIRLARFNVQLVGFDKEFFRGLPIPAQGVTIASFVLSYANNTSGITGWHADVFAPMVAALSLLMVSSLRYDTLPRLSKRSFKEHPFRFSLFLVAGVLIAATKGEALLPVLAFFIASGALRWIVKTIQALTRHATAEDEEEAEVSSLDI